MDRTRRSFMSLGCGLAAACAVLPAFPALASRPPTLDEALDRMDADAFGRLLSDASADTPASMVGHALQMRRLGEAAFRVARAAGRTGRHGIVDSLNLTSLLEASRDPRLDTATRDAARAWVESLPGYRAGGVRRQPRSTLDQHGYREMWVLVILLDLAHAEDVGRTSGRHVLEGTVDWVKVRGARHRRPSGRLLA